MTPPPSPTPLRRGLVALAFAAQLAFTFHQGSPSSDDARRELAGSVAFREIAHEVGIDFTHAPTRVDEKVAGIAPHITAVGASVSVADADGDGRPELYATSSAHGAPNALYRDRGDGTFE